MKISEMTPEQIAAKREYDRAAKQRSRAKQKAARYTPTYDEAMSSFAADFPLRAQELDKFVKDFVERVETELGRNLDSKQKDPYVWDGDESYTVDRIARCLLGLKRGWVQRVREPDGELVSGLYFADALGSAVESVHQHGLKQSPTFCTAYVELLGILDRRYGGETTEDAAIIKRESAGKYVLPPPPEPEPKPEPKLEPKPTPAPTNEPDLVPGDGEVVEQDRVRPSVHDPNISLHARRYLDGAV